MKKITLFLVLFSTLPFYAQQHRVAARVRQLNAQHTAITRFSPLSVQPGSGSKEMEAVVKNATFAHLDTALAKQITHTAPRFIELAIPYNGATVTLQLYKAEIFAQGFHADTDNQKGFTYNPGAYYRGIIKGDEASLASFSFFDGEIKGTISSGQLDNLVVAHLPQEREMSSYIIYSDGDLTIPQDFACGSLPNGTLQPVTRRNAATPADAAHCATIYYEIDNDIFIQNNSSQQATGNWLTALFNNVQTLYDNDGITISLKSFMVWTTQDPYSGADSVDYLAEFFSRYTNQDFDGDVGQLLGSDPGSLGGVAVLGGLCSAENGNVSYIDLDDISFQPVPLFSWAIKSVSHELGHLFGSAHTHDCAWNGNDTPIDSCGLVAGFPGEGTCAFADPLMPPEGGTIMSYCHLTPVGTNLANGFGPQPAQRILDFINASPCVGTSCAAQACHSYITSVTKGITNWGAVQISWMDETAGPWEISYHPIGVTGEWETVVSATGVELNNLLPNTYYIFEVRPVCDQGVPATTQLIFSTDADWCSGQVFTDTGGTDGGYGINQRFTKTFTPSAANNKIKVDFTSFGLEDGFDFLRVYDGADTSAPLIGDFTGFGLPGSFISTADDGSLTVEFISDEVVTGSGWIADVSCQAILGTNETTFANFTYYPNPATSSVTITSGEPMTQLNVYNATGQLLLSKQVNATNLVTDISSFSAGVYFFKASGNNKAANFAIIKY
jgi:Metallo-peptidase family M12/Secretion system C-terminal sorting domain/CUB domain